MSSLRLCYLPPKWEDPDDVESYATALRIVAKKRLSAKGIEREVEIFDALTDYRERSAALGSWNAWIQEVVTGLRVTDYTPTYHGFLVKEDEVGRATAGIIQGALQAYKPVWKVDPDNGGFPWRAVRSVTRVDPDSWVTGWRLDYGT